MHAFAPRIEWDATKARTITEALTKRLQDGVRLEDLLLHPRGHVARHRAQVLQHELGGLRFAGARLARYDARLRRGAQKGQGMLRLRMRFFLLVLAHVCTLLRLRFLRRSEILFEYRTWFWLLSRICR